MQITLHNLSVAFTTAGGSPLQAVGPVSLTVDSGSFVTLLGPSGSGKSTLIRVVAGLQPPTTGTATVDQRLISEPLDGVALMFQQANLMPWRTVLDNIALPLALRGMSKAAQRERVRQFLPALGLQDFEDAYPAALSGGMAQRVALGRVLVQQPDVLLLDEPFGALDALTRETISMDLLRVWAQYQQTVLMVTHDINEAVLLSDYVIVLSQRPGRIIANIEVPLPRPRSVEMIYTEEFITTAKAVRKAIDGA